MLNRQSNPGIFIEDIYIYKHIKNNNFNKQEILQILSPEDIDAAYKTISSWKNYSPTPLIFLNKLNKKGSTLSNLSGPPKLNKITAFFT